MNFENPSYFVAIVAIIITAAVAYLRMFVKSQLRETEERLHHFYVTHEIHALQLAAIVSRLLLIEHKVFNGWAHPSKENER